MSINLRRRKVLFFRIFLICVLSLCISNMTMAQSAAIERMSFNKGWLFQKNDPSEIVEKDANGKVIKSQLDYALIKDWYCATGAEFILPTDSVQATKRPAGNLGSTVTYVQTGFNDKNWRQLNLPHDWGIEGAFSYDLPGNTGKLPWAGTGWYRKHFNVAATDKGRQFSIEIDGAMAYPLVWLNGQFVGGWPYGYNSFRLDLTPYIKVGGENVIAIRLYNPENSSRWYPGSGIYRNVWLVKTAPVHIGHWGTYITTPAVNNESASVDLKVTVENKSGITAYVHVSTQIFELNAAGNKKGVAVSSFNVTSAKIVAGGQQSITTMAAIKNPKLWSTEN